MVLLLHSRSGGPARVATPYLGKISPAKGHEGGVVGNMCCTLLHGLPIGESLMEVSGVSRPSVMSQV